jgi:hypothetical protein
MKIFMKSAISAILVRLLISVAAAMTLSLLVNQIHDIPSKASVNKNEAAPMLPSQDYALKAHASVHDISI